MARRGGHGLLQRGTEFCGEHSPGFGVVRREQGGWRRQESKGRFMDLDFNFHVMGESTLAIIKTHATEEISRVKTWTMCFLAEAMDEPLALLLSSLLFNSEPSNFPKPPLPLENDSVSSLLTVVEKYLSAMQKALI